MITSSNLHYLILKGIIDNGFAPGAEELSRMLKATKNEVEKGLIDLQECHGVVLRPDESKVWAIHPFLLARQFLCKN